MAPVQFGYWNVRGIGHPVRFMLEYVGVKYEEKTYKKQNTDEWFLQDKPKMGLELPNLPYYIDGDFKLTGSLAIMKYLARKYEKSLVGSTDEENAKLEMLEGSIYDFYWSDFIHNVVFTSGNYEKQKEDYINRVLPAKLKQFSEFLGSKKFLIGNQVKYVDFYFYETLRTNSLYAPQVFDNYENLRDYLKRFEELPPISNYMNSARYFRGPCFPAGIAKWSDA